MKRCLTRFECGLPTQEEEVFGRSGGMKKRENRKWERSLSILKSVFDILKAKCFYDKSFKKVLFPVSPLAASPTLIIMQTFCD